MTTLQAGQEVDDQCTKCKLLLAHTIVAMDGTTIVKVECNTCHSVHKYRGPKAKKKRIGAAKKAVAKVIPFEQLIAGKDLSQATRYKISTTFAQDEIIDHLKFGLGIVTHVLGDNKVEVEFIKGGVLHQPSVLNSHNQSSYVVYYYVHPHNVSSCLLFLSMLTIFL